MRPFDTREMHVRLMTWRATFAALVTSMLALVIGVETPDASALHTPIGANPVASGEEVRNVTFYYGGTTTLAGADPERLATTLGRPGIVVTASSSTEARPPRRRPRTSTVIRSGFARASTCTGRPYNQAPASQTPMSTCTDSPTEQVCRRC